MSRISILKRSTGVAIAALVFVGLLLPAHANYRQDAVSVFPDLPTGAIDPADHLPRVLTPSRAIIPGRNNL